VTDPISAALSIGGKLIDRLWPNPEERDKAKLRLMEMAQAGELTELSERAGVIKAEAQSEHTLAAVWRPVTMLTFTGLICAHWLGFTPENLPQDQVLALLEIVQVGLGGYVVGRSVEKAAKAWKG
jgi:hypothetical protein